MRTFLQPPFLTEQAAAMAAHASAAPCPVWLAGGPGAGAYHVARALHRDGDPSGFVSVRRVLAGAGELERRVRAALDADPELDEIALYVERLDRQPAEVQECCLRWMDEGLRSGGRSIPVRVLAQTDVTRVENVRGLRRELIERLGVVMIVLPALRERQDVIPLGRFLASDAAWRIGRPSRRLSDDVIARLADESQTLESFEAAITRALLTPAPETPSPPASPDRVPAGVEAPARTATPPPTTPPLGSSIGVPGYSLDSLVTELAHELKNPMVTIKTFAQHIDQLLADPELRERFARLTNEAVERMDGFLDELLQFSRFEQPVVRVVAFDDLLSRALVGVNRETQRSFRSNGTSSTTRVRVDDAQISFALRALLRGLGRELPAGTEIVLQSARPGELVFQASGSGGARKLKSLLVPEGEEEAETSLHFALADALIRRNGGSCRIVRASESLEAHLTLPVAET